MREVVTAVMRFRDERSTPLSKELDGYFNDLYDHVVRAAEWTESLRDLISSVFETNLSLQDARLNEIMKKLAAWAAIIAVPTAVTGWFGQNIPYPGFSEAFGLFQSVLLILVGSVGLYFVFRRFDWI
ncbi:Cobalt/magnesium transport protein CorA [bioreactor metagenome]|uniref:Cobalt/magnesium transport protein CorA n=1 Tax=bioreactor metagenome TaxID=1076179 RepID=A0A645J164_9ZZZZ